MNDTDNQPEAGFAGGLEGLIFGLLLFVVGTLMVANAWAVVDTKFAVEAAAHQAIRTYVEAPGPAVAGERALAAADASLAGWDRIPSRARISLLGGAWARCSRATIEVSYPAPLLVLPWIGRVGLAEAVSGRHSELVDPFRTGLPGASSCP